MSEVVEPDRPVRRCVAATVVAAVVVAALLYVSGAGGYRGGTLLALGLMAGVPSLVYALTSAAVPNRWTWIATPLVLGLVVGGLIAGVAPPSKGVLVDRLDDVPGDNFTVLSTSERGHSWCSPTCPIVTRVYEGADLQSPQAVFSMAVDLTTAGIIDRPPPVGPSEFTATGDDMTIEVSAERIETDDGGAQSRVTVELRARRG